MKPKKLPELTEKDKARFFAKVGPPVIVPSGRTCRLWQASKHSRTGHGLFRLNGRVTKASRVAKFLEKGDDFNHDEWVLHKCPNRPDCVNPACLYQGDAEDNARDRARDGNEPDRRGSKHPNSKLTETKVLDILERLDAGETQTSIADDYGVGKSTISRIARGVAWEHVLPNQD